MKRVWTAAVGIALVGFTMAWAPPWGLWGLAGLVTGGAWWEFIQLGRRRGILIHWGLTLPVGLALWTLAFQTITFPWVAWMASWLILMLLHGATLFRRNPDAVEAFAQTALWLTLGWSYVMAGGLCLWAIWAIGTATWPRVAFIYQPLVGLLVMVWTCDTAAYYVGRWLGRHRLAPTVSPHKTIEGAVAGIVGACLAAWVWGEAWSGAVHPVFPGWWLIPGLIVGGIGQMGDLFESAWKRWAGVKDSGHWLPGHGGVLDRIDSLIFSAPFYYLYWDLGLRRFFIE